MTIDTTQLSTFITCPMKYNLKFNMGLKKRALDETSIDKVFGQCVHKGLENYYRLRCDVSRVVSAFDGFQDVENESCKTGENGKKLLQAYLEHYKELDRDMEVLDVEKKITFRIGDIDYVVKLDTIIKLRDNIYSLEHKTTKRLNGFYFNQFNPNMQISAQTQAIKEAYGQCSGVIVNALNVGYRSRKYKDEPAGFHCEFQREIVNRTKEQIEDFRWQVGHWCNKLRDCTLSGIWTKNEGSCDNYRGCQYKQICLTSCCGELDEQVVDTLYEVVDTKEYLKDRKVDK